HQAEALAHPADQAGQGPARRGVGPFYGWGGGRALGGADHRAELGFAARAKKGRRPPVRRNVSASGPWALEACTPSITVCARRPVRPATDRKSTRLNSSHDQISYAVFCLKKKKKKNKTLQCW